MEGVSAALILGGLRWGSHADGLSQVITYVKSFPTFTRLTPPPCTFENCL